jgi:hypothetical protein
MHLSRTKVENPVPSLGRTWCATKPAFARRAPTSRWNRSNLLERRGHAVGGPRVAPSNSTLQGGVDFIVARGQRHCARPVSPQPKLSAIVLCYRAGHSAPRVLDPLSRVLSESGVSHQLVLVANYHRGKPDPTLDVVRQWAADRQEVRVVARPKKGGMG